MYFLGIDAGGTQCRARLTDSTGRIIGSGLSGPGNVRKNYKQAFSAITDAYFQAIREAELSANNVAQIRACFGIAGIGRTGTKAELQMQPLPFHEVLFTNDAVIANIGAHSGQDGGVVIVGTGSIGIGRIAGKSIRVGGYGFPISDEGSGAYIGAKALSATLSAADGRVEHSGLTTALFRNFDYDIQVLNDWLDTATPKDFAAFAERIITAANDSDPVGYEIVQNAAKHIETLIKSLFKYDVPRIALCGGIGEPIKPWLSPRINAKLVKPDGDALDGALWLARQNSI
ncbi:MAG: N-acetylglucosamine kinase [Robiginitomaculum sp.]|nr:N-acetylglucosamine kinase [Robiginitomaculum sp.]